MSEQVDVQSRAWLAGALLFLGCQTSPPNAQVRDSASVAIVESSEPLDGGASQYRVDSVPMIHLGVDDSRGEFATWDAVAVLPNRATVVAVATARELRFFDSQGRFVRSAGREGSGPGEFRQFNLLATFADSIIVFDLGVSRVSVFDSAGRYARGTTLPAFVNWPLQALGDGRLLIAIDSGPPPTPGLSRHWVTVGIANQLGTEQRTLGWFPVVDEQLEVLKEGVSMGPIPFPRQTAWASVDSLVLIGTGDFFGYQLYHDDGRLARSVRRRFTPVSVTEAEVRLVMEERLVQFPPNAEAAKDQFRQYFLNAPRLPTKPPYDQVMTVATGEVWIREYDSPGRGTRPSIYSVFDRDGRWLTQVQVPTGIDPAVIQEDRILARRADEDGIVRLAWYRLINRSRSE